MPVDGPGPDPRAARRLRRKAFRSVTRQIWLAEAREGYTLARARANANGVPLLLVGFSLGAAIGTDLAIETARPAAFDGMILFAPPFIIRWHTRLLRLLAPLRHLSLYSLSPRKYAANRSTPIAAYNALFESVAAVARGRARQLEIAALKQYRRIRAASPRAQEKLLQRFLRNKKYQGTRAAGFARILAKSLAEKRKK